MQKIDKYNLTKINNLFSPIDTTEWGLIFSTYKRLPHSKIKIIT